MFTSIHCYFGLLLPLGTGTSVIVVAVVVLFGGSNGSGSDDVPRGWVPFEHDAIHAILKGAVKEDWVVSHVNLRSVITLDSDFDHPSTISTGDCMPWSLVSDEWKNDPDWQATLERAATGSPVESMGFIPFRGGKAALVKEHFGVISYVATFAGDRASSM
jgi:hypothetical protein